MLFASNASGGAGSGGGGGGSGGGGGGSGGGGSSNPSDYLFNLYKWFLGAVGISALFAIVTGGVLYMFSGTSLTKTDQARGWIQNGIWGIVLAAISYLLLNTINPDLVKGFNLDELVQNAVNETNNPNPSN